jgi:hypothetical protein
MHAIPTPLDQIPPTPHGPTPPNSKNNFDAEHSLSNSDDNMGENRNCNDHIITTTSEAIFFCFHIFFSGVKRK